MTGLSPEQQLRVRAGDSLHYGALHAGGAPALDGFGYVGLRLDFAGQSERERSICREAYQTLVTEHAGDTRIVRSEGCKRILVRAFGADNKVTDAFRVALDFARTAGV